MSILCIFPVLAMIGPHNRTSNDWISTGPDQNELSEYYIEYYIDWVISKNVHLLDHHNVVLELSKTRFLSHWSELS
jgi:hypothetical protein